MIRRLYKSVLPKNIRDSSGFTLLEILVASAIASTIMIMVATSYKSILRSVRDISGYAEFYEDVNLAIYRIDKDITNTYFKRRTKSKIKPVFTGELDDDGSRLDIVSTVYSEMNMLGSTKNAFRISDIKEIGYYLEEDENTQGVKFLIRREEKHYDDDPVSGGERNILLRNVVNLKFEFKRGNDWIGSWDSRRTRQVPVAVKTTLVVKNYMANDEKFVFISNINMR